MTASDLRSHAKALLTPDFYEYADAPLQSAKLAGDWVELRWPDGQSLRCYNRWLSENSAGRGFDEVSRETIIDPADLAAASLIESATVDPAGQLALTWADREERTIHAGWLRHVVDAKHHPNSYLPAPTRWTSSTFSEPPTIDGTNVLEDPQVLRDWLRALREFGLARLANTPEDREFLETLAQRFGPIRVSNFGTMFTVEARLERDSTAYTGLNLGQHTDLPTRETPPGFQFLHCVENTVNGGWSRMTDGAALVAELAENEPAAYEALTTLRWIFFNRSPDSDHRWSGPMIDHGSSDQPLTLRAFYPVRAFPDMADKDVPRAYEAMEVFSRLAHDARFQIRFPFRAGDVVGFDNRRVLHGRDAFEPSEGTRVLRGAYVDQDDVYSALRVLERASEVRNRPRPESSQGESCCSSR